MRVGSPSNSIGSQVLGIDACAHSRQFCLSGMALARIPITRPIVCEFVCANSALMVNANIKAIRLQHFTLRNVECPYLTLVTSCNGH